MIATIREVVENPEPRHRMVSARNVLCSCLIFSDSYSFAIAERFLHSACYRNFSIAESPVHNPGLDC